MEALRKHIGDIKHRHPGVVVLIRSHEDYISIDGDADLLSELLKIEKVSDDVNGSRVTGFSKNLLDTYLPKMIRSGMRVAITEP